MVSHLWAGLPQWEYEDEYDDSFDAYDAGGAADGVADAEGVLLFEIMYMPFVGRAHRRNLLVQQSEAILTADAPVNMALLHQDATPMLPLEDLCAEACSQADTTSRIAAARLPQWRFS